jgi:MFS family permease
VLCVSLLVIVVDNTIVNVTLPTLVRDLNADLSELQWVVDAYTLVFAGLLLLAGTLGDRFGRRRTLLAGLIAERWVSPAETSRNPASSWSAAGSLRSSVPSNGLNGVGCAG